MAKKLSAEEFENIRKSGNKTLTAEEFNKIKERGVVENSDPSLGERALGAVAGASQGLSLGTADELISGAGVIKDILTGSKGIKEAYADRLAEVQQGFADIRERTPGEFLAGDVGASIVAALAPIPGAKTRAGLKIAQGGAAAAKALKLGKFGRALAKGAAVGATEGAARAKPGERLKKGATGALFGTGGALVGRGVSKLASGTLSKVGKAAKLGARSKEFEVSLPKAIGSVKKGGLVDEALESRLVRNIDNLEELGVIKPGDITTRSGAVSDDVALAITKRNVAKGVQLSREGDELVEAYVANNPKRFFTAQELNLDALKSEMAELTSEAIKLDPSTNSVNQILKDLTVDLADEGIDIVKLKKLNTNVNLLAHDLYFKNTISTKSGKAIKSVSDSLKGLLEQELGPQFKRINKDMSSVLTLGESMQGHFGKEMREMGLSEGAGVIDLLGAFIEKKGFIGAATAGAGKGVRKLQAPIDVLDKGFDIPIPLSGGRSLPVPSLTGAPLPSTLGGAFTGGPKKTLLDPTNSDERIMIKDRILKRFARGELDSREMADKMQRLNRLQEADTEDSRIIQPPEPDQPNLDLLNNILRDKQNEPR
jgi:hypothetical protein